MSTFAALTATDSLLTPEEAAHFLRVNPRTLERWRGDGGGPRFAKIGRRVAYRLCDLTAFVDGHLHSHTHSARIAPLTTRPGAPTTEGA